MNAPAQLALPSWLAKRSSLQQQLTQRVKSNLAALRGSGLEVLRLEAGWSAVVRIRSFVLQPQLCAADVLLAELGVIVHPGSFYGISDTRTAVVSLLTLPEIVTSAVSRIKGRFGA